MLALVVAASTVALYLAGLCWRIWLEAKDSAREEVRVFAHTFPGRCLVCSYHRYGVDYGHVDPAERPPAHVCIEEQP